jgi:hypothetical protein
MNKKMIGYRNIVLMCILAAFPIFYIQRYPLPPFIQTCAIVFIFLAITALLSCLPFNKKEKYGLTHKEFLGLIGIFGGIFLINTFISPLNPYIALIIPFLLLILIFTKQLRNVS